ILFQSVRIDIAEFLDWFSRHLPVATTCEFLPHHSEHTAAVAEPPAYACIDGHMGICSCVAKATMRLAYFSADGNDQIRARLPNHLRMDVQDERTLLDVLLLINTEVATLWNIRRCHYDQLTASDASLLSKAEIESELNYVKLCLSVRPKSQTVFVYR
uniref:Anaphase-promoting complex subunit 1 n=1 Tax=Macrostomum lignano TaxID=282301 RepID=A0A1I8I9V6_9PLAT